MDTNSSTGVHLLVPSKHQEGKTCVPERITESIEPESKPNDQKVPVVYYLSLNGQLQQPHVILVPLSSPQGLYLRDVINRLNFVRGQGMATMYTWSCKRRYRNGFVWQDLSEYDSIDPCDGQDYVLKGSQKFPESPWSFRSSDTSSDSSKICTTGWSSPVIVSDSDDCKVYKTRTTAEFSKNAAHITSLKECLEADKSAEFRDQMIKNDCSSRRMKAYAVLMQFIACGIKRRNC